MRQQIGNGDSGLAAGQHWDVGAERQQPVGALMTMLLWQRGIHRLAMPLLDERLWIKEVHLRGTAGHKEKYDTLCPRLNDRGAHSERIRCRLQQTMHGHRTKTCAGLTQPSAAGGGEG
jgi:hypothetical protein